MKRGPVWIWLTLLACSRRDPAPSPTVEIPARPGPAVPAAPQPRAFGERADERRRLVDRIAERGVQSAAVLDALRRVPRHAFVAASWAAEAYQDRPLPIGHGQTISQPTVVASMTEAVAPTSKDRCLEIGTGSGYQAAVLAELCAKVFSIEYVAPLARDAEKVLRGLGYGDPRLALRTGDGYAGWPEAAPFQVVVVTAAPERVPPPLLQQLDVGGRLVIPVGPQGEGQELMLYTRIKPGSTDDCFEKRSLMAVRFVPFLGDAVERSPR